MEPPRFKPYGEPPNHWAELHQFAPRFARGWTAGHAEAFYRGWCNRIPDRGGCNCSGKWIALDVQFDFSTAESFFESAWRGHNLVSDAIGKPQITLNEAYAIWWNQRFPYL